jgi:hypothetical protein
MSYHLGRTEEDTEVKKALNKMQEIDEDQFRELIGELDLERVIGESVHPLCR